MLTLDQKQFAVADANARLVALIDLTKFNDQQAIGLLQFYVTLGVAALGAAFAGQAGVPIFGISGSVAAASFAVVILLGALQCHRAMIPGAVPFPGRDVEFWLTVRDNEGWSFEAALDAYLDEAKELRRSFREAHRVGAQRLTLARRAAYVAPFIGLIAGILTAAYCVVS